MLLKENLHFSKIEESTAPGNLSPFKRLLIRILIYLKISRLSFKLEYYERMTGFLKFTGIIALLKNAEVSPNGEIMVPEEFHSHRLIDSLFDFLEYNGIICQLNERYILHRNFEYLGKIPKDETERIKKGELVPFEVKGPLKRLLEDYLFINDLIQKYRDPHFRFKSIQRHHRSWEKLVATKQLDYEVRLSETLQHLKDLEIPKKIASPYDDAYYTESGRNAFFNYTQYHLPGYLRQITGKEMALKVFDLGCGYGNYIQLLNQHFPESNIVGIELNPQVALQTKERFAENSNIKILNKDVFDYNSEHKFDLILMNYVFFYFDLKQKGLLLEKLRSMLTENGSILLCQYFSGIDKLRKQLAIKNNDFGIARQIEIYYSNKVLFANTLWNDSVDAFSEAAKWDDLMRLLDTAGLEIQSITNADRFYYSLFIEIKAS